MEDVGGLFRRKREAAGLPIEEAASRTKIAIDYIKAIEDNDFDQMPSLVSTKGFLKSYARCLGLDESEVLQMFIDSFPKLKVLPTAEVKTGITSYIQLGKTERLPIPLSVIIWGGLALLLFVILNLFNLNPTSSGSKQGPPTPISNNPAGTMGKPPPHDATDEGPPASGVPALSPPSPVTTLSPSSEENFLVLVIEALEPSWVKVVIDNTEKEEALLQAKDKIRWKGKKKFLLTTGNAGGIRVTLNGEDVGSLGPRGKVLHDVPIPR